MNPLEKAINNPTYAKKFQKKVAKDVEDQIDQRTLAEKQEAAVKEAKQIVKEMKPDLFKVKREEGKVVKLGAGKKTPVGKNTPHGHRSVTRDTIVA